MVKKNRIIMFLLVLTAAIPAFALAGPLPDTGQTKCYNNSEEITCPQPGVAFYGQDANYTINTPSYTKLDANGNDLPYSASLWGMVRDNLTGLIWEVKTDDGSIHDKDDKYNWQDAQDVFVSNLNASSFGGYSDWRLPTIKELSFLVNSGTYSPAINTNYFPYSMSYGYWSSTTYAEDTNLAWHVSFSYGDVNASLKESYPFHVRAVRGALSDNAYVDNGDGTVTDTSTGLMWQKETVWVINWESALTYCEGLSLAGRDDWRLPNRNELQSLIDYNEHNPSIDPAFPDTMASEYWSSTTHACSTSLAWHAHFHWGNIGSSYVKSSYSYYVYVRAVRGGRPIVLDSTSETNGTLTITGHLENIDPIPNYIGADDPIGQECTAYFAEVDSQGNFSKSWDITNVKPGNYQLLVYIDSENSIQISLPVIGGSSSKKFYKMENINIDIGPLGTPGIYLNPTTLSCSVVSGDCEVVAPTLEDVKENLRAFGDFMMDWTDNFFHDVAKNPVNIVAGAGVLTCFIPTGITQATTCPASVTFLAASAKKSAVASFLHTVIDNSELTSSKKQEVHSYINLGSAAYSFITLEPGHAVVNAMEITSASFEAADTTSYVDLRYKNSGDAPTSSDAYVSSGNGSDLAGVYIVAERTDGTIVGIAITEPKRQSLPWLMLLLGD